MCNIVVSHFGHLKTHNRANENTKQQTKKKYLPTKEAKSNLVNSLSKTDFTSNLSSP